MLYTASFALLLSLALCDASSNATVDKSGYVLHSQDVSPERWGREKVTP